MKMMRMAAVAAVACLALGGCAQDDGTTAPPAAPGGSPVTTSPADPVPTDPTAGAEPPAPTAPSATSDASGPTSLTGVVTPGVEPNCLLLDNYLLVGGPRDQLRSGARVTVTGRVRSDLMTTCQQGTPFQVEQVRPA